MPVSNIIQKLQCLIIKNIDISNNFLGNKGLLVLVDELVKHNELEELNIGNNMISDIGLRCLKNLKQCENIKKITIGKNFGISDEILHELNGLPIEY